MACGPKFQMVMSILRRAPSAHHDWAFYRIDKVLVSIFVINHRPGVRQLTPSSQYITAFSRIAWHMCTGKKKLHEAKNIVSRLHYEASRCLGIVFRPQILPKKKIIAGFHSF